MKRRVPAGLTAPALVNNCDIRKTVNGGHGERWTSAAVAKTHRLLRLKLDKGVRRGDRPGSERPGAA